MDKSNRSAPAPQFLPPGHPAAGAPPTAAVRPLGSTRRSLLPRHLPPLAPLSLARPVVHRLTEPEFPPVAPPSYAPVVVPTAIPSVMPAALGELPVLAPPALMPTEQRSAAAPRVVGRRPVRVAMTLDLEPDAELPTGAAGSLAESPDGAPEVATPGFIGDGDGEIFQSSSAKEVREPPPFLLMDSSPDVTDAHAVDGVIAEHAAPLQFTARSGERRGWRGVGLAVGLCVAVITVLGVRQQIFSAREPDDVVASRVAPARAEVEAEVEATPPALAEPPALVVASPPTSVAPTPEGKPARRSSRAALQRLAARAKACRQSHRAVGGPEILVWYGVGRNGRTIRPQANVSGPLAQCLVEAVRRTKFPKRRQMGLEALL